MHLSRQSPAETPPPFPPRSLSSQRPVLRTKGGETEFCPHGGLVLRTNGGRRRFFGNIYFTNRPLVACSAVNPLNNPGVYGTKLPWAAFGDVSFTGRGRERSGKTGRDRERSGGQSTTCRAGRWLGWPATNTVYFVPGPPNIRPAWHISAKFTKRDHRHDFSFISGADVIRIIVNDQSLTNQGAAAPVV